MIIRFFASVNLCKFVDNLHFVVDSIFKNSNIDEFKIFFP
jgi:hypothetical protein